MDGDGPQFRSLAEENAELRAENARLKADLEETRQLLDEARTLAEQDPLAAVLNRRAFLQALGRAIARCERHGDAAALAYFDLDGLKQVNDTYGHVVGDAVISHVGAYLASAVRKSDVAGRIGGDEFAVLFWRSDQAQADESAQRIIVGLRDHPLERHELKLTINASYGVCPLSSGLTPEMAMERADAAMYAEKRRRQAMMSGNS